jgi:hypothetical protein
MDFIYEYASPALKVELGKLSRDDEERDEKTEAHCTVDDFWYRDA